MASANDGNQTLPDADIDADDAEEFEWPRLLGSADREVHGREYAGRFTGTGYVTSDYDEGSFLSDGSFKQRRRSRKLRWNRRWLDMEQLFPEEWREAKVEYEITVRARRLSPLPRPRG